MEMENIVESPASCFKTLFSFLLRTHLRAHPPQTNQQSNTLTTNQLRECGNNRKGGVAVVLQEHLGFVEMRYGRRFKGCGYCGSAPVRGKGSVRIWHGRHSPLASRLVLSGHSYVVCTFPS